MGHGEEEMMSEEREKVIIPRSLEQILGVRMWGRPTGCYIGSCWIFRREVPNPENPESPEVEDWFQVFLASPENSLLSIGAWRVEWSEGWEFHFPPGVEGALRQYALQWPDSARFHARALPVTRDPEEGGLTFQERKDRILELLGSRTADLQRQKRPERLLSWAEGFQSLSGVMLDWARGRDTEGEDDE